MLKRRPTPAGSALRLAALARRQGGGERAFLDALKRGFRAVRHVKPPASRKDSSELYVVATGFRGGDG